MKTRLHVLSSSKYWFEAAHQPGKCKDEALMCMVNAYNHLENALVHIVNNSTDAKAIFESVSGKWPIEKKCVTCEARLPDGWKSVTCFHCSQS